MDIALELKNKEQPIGVCIAFKFVKYSRFSEKLKCFVTSQSSLSRSSAPPAWRGCCPGRTGKAPAAEDCPGYDKQHRRSVPGQDHRPGHGVPQAVNAPVCVTPHAWDLPAAWKRSSAVNRLSPCFKNNNTKIQSINLTLHTRIHKLHTNSTYEVLGAVNE